MLKSRFNRAFRIATFERKFAKILRTPILKKIGERLLLKPVQLSLGLPFFDNFHFWLKLVVLGKLPPRKISPSLNSNANPKPNPDPDRGAIFLGGNFPDTQIGTYALILYLNLQFRLPILPSLPLVLLK